MRVASPVAQASLAQLAGAQLGSRVTLPRRALSPQNSPRGRAVYISPPRRAPSPQWVSPSMATLATSAMSGSGRPMPCIPVGVASNTSPVRFVASPRTYESPRVAKVLLPQSSQVTHSAVPRAPSPVSPVRVAAMQQMYAPVARRARPSNPPTPAHHPMISQPVPVAQPAQPVVQPVVQQASRPIVAQWAPSPVPRVLPAKLVPRQQVSPLRQSPSPVRLKYQVPGTASPVQIAVPKPSPLDSPRSTATAATICPVPLSTPAYSERTIASPVVLSSLGRQSPHEKAALRAADRLAETARASLTNGLLWRPAPRPTPDPLLTALGTGGSSEDCCAMASTPDPPESRKLSAVLESQPSLASSFCPGRESPGPQYTSAILLRTPSSKQNRRQISPGASCVVRPPSPQDPQGPKMMPGSFEELVANGAKAGALKVTLALFDLFCAAVSENSIVEQVCVELSLQLKREELQWDQLVLLRPLQTLAQTVASLMSGSGPLKEETFWSMLGDEEEYMPWWKALLARHGLQRSGQVLSQEQLADLITSACRMLRDSFAPESYLRNLRTVRFGAHRLQDRYEDFQLLTPSRFGRTYRCRGRLSFEERLCTQVRKDRMACPADQVRAEAETLRSMHNANLHRVVESFEDFNSIYIISELVDSIRLLAFLRSQYDAKFEITESWVSQVMRQVLEALGFCHQKKPRSIVHGDLGMDSVGLASISDPATSPHVIISDPALAGILSSPGNKFCDLPATPWWRHDQSLEAELEQCGPKQDVWACGCLLYILLSGCMPLKTNEICFGGPFHPPEKSSFYDIEWSHLRHASAQAEALCSRMLESNPAQRPTADECLCYPWLQPGATSVLCNVVPTTVFERLLQYDARIRGSKEVANQVMNHLSSSKISCASSVFAKATLPRHFDGTLESLDKVQMTPLGGVAPLLQLGLSVQIIERIMQTYDVDGQGNVAHGFFVRRCMELAEDHVDRALWHIFIAANEDHRGVLSASKLEQVLDGQSWELPGLGKGSEDNDMEGRARIRAAVDPELTASEAVRQIAPTGTEVTFEALKEFVLQRHDKGCAAAAQELGLL